MTAQMELFDVDANIIAPTVPGVYRQPAIRFTGFRGHVVDRLVTSALSTDTTPEKLARTRWAWRELQKEHGRQPDAEIVWRTVTCSEWETP